MTLDNGTLMTVDLSQPHLVFPKEMTDISRTLFQDSKNVFNEVQSIAVEEGNPRYAASGNCLIDTACNTLILGCNRSVIPENNIHTIGPYAFQGCLELTHIRIPRTVSNVRRMAFAYTGLEELILPRHLQHLDAFALAFNPQLQRVYVTSDPYIGKAAFGTKGELDDPHRGIFVPDALCNRLELFICPNFYYPPNIDHQTCYYASHYRIPWEWRSPPKKA